jgi:tRNA-(ms[2]io[6]A)-hydroxylase
MGVLRLKLPTDPRWVNIVEKNIEEILTDHAWCEQKAATNAITIITNNPEHQDLVKDLLASKEEIDHFEQVHNIIIKGMKLGRELQRQRKRIAFVHEEKWSRVSSLVKDYFSAMIEARSCERFKVLSENQDEELSVFCQDLMERKGP